jgi:hypothetical protein
LHLQKEWAEDLAGITPRLMTVFGPWNSADEVPDVAIETQGRGRALTTKLGTLVVGMENAFFLVRITTPPVAAGKSGVGLARHALSVPTILVCDASLRVPLFVHSRARATASSPIALYARFLSFSPCTFRRPARGRRGLGHGGSRERRGRCG